MPGKVKVKIVSGRSLPVMDRSNDTTDAYVEVKLGQVTHKTDVCRKSLNPQWNSEWFKFEMDDLELQDEPLQIRLMDYDTYSANDAIGKVYLDLNPLLINPAAKVKDNYGKTIMGWIPVYDTMHGIRGEVNLIVKVELFSDLNKYRQSSCGVRFFFSPQIPEGFIAHSVNGFVEELVINDDPEYQWIDKIRTPRASNEARQTLFQKLSGEVQRRVGLKALELGGNAVVAYKQSLDLEGESGIVIRGIGTAMYLTRLYENQLSPVPMTSTSSDPITNNAINKESLFHQHSLPRNPTSRLQRSFRLLENPLSSPSMLSSAAGVGFDTDLPSSSSSSLTKAKTHKFHSHSRHYRGLSSSFSNLVKISKKASNKAANSDDSDSRSKSPKLLTSSIATLTGGISPNEKKILSSKDSSRKYNSDEESKTLPRKSANSSSSRFANTSTSALLTYIQKDTDRKDVDKKDTTSLAKSRSPLELDKHLAQIESDFLLEVDLQSETLPKVPVSEISSETQQVIYMKSTHIKHFNLAASGLPRPRTLSEKEMSDSISEDSPPTSPTSSVQAFTLLNLKKKRWITRRERLSTNCLVKRATSGTPTQTLVKSGSTAKFKRELGKLFKRISFSGEGDSDSNPTTLRTKPKSPTTTTSKSPYRQPRRLFFRKRRKSRSVRAAESYVHHHSHGHGQITRSTSESHSLSIRQTSSESIPSIGSEPPVFHLDDDDDLSEENCSSLVEIPTYLQDTSAKSEAAKKSSQVEVDPSKLRELVGDLGYDMRKPLKLYISSMDALLVYDPPNDLVNSSCVCLNVDNDTTTTTTDVVDSHTDIKIREKVDTLLRLRRNESTAELCRPTTIIHKKRQRNDTLVECHSCASNSSSTSSSGGTSSATSSSCKGFRTLHKLRRTDDDDVEDEELQNYERFEKFMKSVHDSVTLGTGCRSPIPEELVESSCATPTLNTQNQIQSSTSPPKIPTNLNNTVTSPLKPSANLNGTTTNGHTDVVSNPNQNSGIKSGSPEKGMNKTGRTEITPKTSFPAQGHGQMYRRSSESDLSTTPKGTCGTAFMTKNQHIYRPLGINLEQLRMQEFPFLTISQFPEGFIYYLGGTVTARSVKLLDRIGNFEEPDPESRDAWWNELRIEMRSHCRAFGCTVILGYEEQTTMCDEVCIMSASGTAAIILQTGNMDAMEGDGVNVKEHRRNDSFTNSTQQNNASKTSPKASRGRHESDGNDLPCSMLHIPHVASSLKTTKIKKTRCAYCKKGKVPDVILSTIEIPSELHTTGHSCLVQTQVFRSKKESKGETSAKEMSDSLPFLEYELHRRLINKLKVKGMNAIFGLEVQISQGEKLMVGIATGTAVFLTSLPPPSVPIICAGNLKTDAQKVLQFQKVIQETFDKNRDMFQVKNIVVPNHNMGSAGGGPNSVSDGESDDECDDELLNQNKDTFILEVDDAEDIDIITMLIDPTPPVGYNMSNIETLVGFEDYRVVSQQMFNQVWRCKIPSLSLRQLTTYFDRLIRSITFKLRRMQPCVLSKLSFKCDLPEQDEMQLCIIGMALGLDKKPLQVLHQIANQVVAEESEMIFPFDDDKSGATQTTETTCENEQPKIQPKSTLPSTLISSKTMSSNAGFSLNVSQSFSQGNPNVSAHPLPQTNVSCPSSSRKTSLGQCQFTRSDSSSSTTTSNSNTNAEGQSDGDTARQSVFSVRHPNSNRTTRFMTLYKPIPSPVSKMRHWVEITPLSSIPGSKIERYLGNLNFFFIRETTSLREVSGGLSGFVHNFFTEVLAIVRSHVSALGGNAMVSYFMTECALLHNPHKNQSQCVVNVGGDAVYVSYPSGAYPEDGVSSAC